MGCPNGDRQFGSSPAVRQNTRNHMTMPSSISLSTEPRLARWVGESSLIMRGENLDSRALDTSKAACTSIFGGSLYDEFLLLIGFKLPRHLVLLSCRGWLSEDISSN